MFGPLFFLAAALPVQSVEAMLIDPAPTVDVATIVQLRVVKPFGCYQTSVRSDGEAGFTHVLVPELTQDALDPCLPDAGVDYVSVDLGRLPAGRHQLQVVQNGMIYADFWFVVALAPASR